MGPWKSAETGNDESRGTARLWTTVSGFESLPPSHPPPFANVSGELWRVWLIRHDEVPPKLTLQRAGQSSIRFRPVDGDFETIRLAE